MQLLGKLQRFSFAAPRVYQNFVNGEFVASKGTKYYEVYNPATQEHIARSPQTTEEEFNSIIASSKEAFKTWSKVPLLSTPLVTQPVRDICSNYQPSFEEMLRK